MPDVTLLLNAIDAGDPLAADQLLPLVYEELRRLAAAKMAQEKPGQTLQATALVHEAWLRLAGANQQWQAYAGGLRSTQSGRCLDVPASNTTNGTQLILWDCHDVANQKWTLPGT